MCLTCLCRTCSCVLRASCSSCSLASKSCVLRAPRPYVLCDLRVFVPPVLSVLRALVPQLPCALSALMPHVSLLHMLLCLTCSHASSPTLASFLAFSMYQSHTLFSCVCMFHRLLFLFMSYFQIKICFKICLNYFHKRNCDTSPDSECSGHI